MAKLHLVTDVNAGETMLLNIEHVVTARRMKNMQGQVTGCTVKLINGEAIHIGTTLDLLQELADQ